MPHFDGLPNTEPKIAKTEKISVEVIRHIRPRQVDTNINQIVFGPTGGVTLKFNLHQPSGKLSYWYAVCRDDENFAFDIANNIVEGRSRTLEPIAVENYNRNIGLVENVLVDLEQKLSTFLNTEYVDIGYEDYVALHRKLNRLMTKNEKLIAKTKGMYLLKPASYSGK